MLEAPAFCCGCPGSSAVPAEAEELGEAGTKCTAFPPDTAPDPALGEGSARLLGLEIALLFLSAFLPPLTCLFASWSSESFYQITMVTAVEGQISLLMLAHLKRHPSGLGRHHVWQP